MSIGDNIKAIRQRYGLTQLQFGEIAGVSDKAVSTWESGAKEPRMGAIQRIADYFGISKSSIIEDEGFSMLSTLVPDEIKLIEDYRILNSQGKELIRQQMALALMAYSGKNNVTSDMEAAQ